MTVDDDSVQSQQSLESGIMVMVAGNFFVDQGSPQHFSQTFFVAENQEAAGNSVSYYIKNSMFYVHGQIIPKEQHTSKVDDSPIPSTFSFAADQAVDGIEESARQGGSSINLFKSGYSDHTGAPTPATQSMKSGLPSPTNPRIIPLPSITPLFHNLSITQPLSLRVTAGSILEEMRLIGMIDALPAATGLVEMAFDAAIVRCAQQQQHSQSLTLREDGEEEEGLGGATEAQEVISSCSNKSCRKLCSVCSLPSTFKCGKCLVARYCSMEHQKKDWCVHKGVCEGLGAGLRRDEMAALALVGYAASPASIFALTNDILAHPLRTHRAKAFIGMTWLLLQAMRKCLRVGPGLVFRAARGEVRKSYRAGTTITWPSFVVCTSSQPVLEQAMNEANGHDAVIFEISLMSGGQARDVSAHMATQGGHEVLLPPNSRLHVTEVVDVTVGRTTGSVIIRLKELPPSDPIMSLVSEG